MKIGEILAIILFIFYGYWMTDIYVFIYENNIYNPEKLDDYFYGFKVAMYLLNYPILITIIIVIIPYKQINKILNKKININFNIFKNKHYE